MQNPYINKKMLPHDSDMFFGRSHEMGRIEGLLNSEHPQSVSIVGERRIGKSSIANRIYHKFKNAENTIAVFLDCDGMECDSQEDFFQILSREIADTGKYEGELFSDFKSAKDFIKKESKKGLKFIVFIDEFEHLPQKKFADNDFFSFLRSLASNSEEYRLAFVTISQSELKKLTHKAVLSSGFWNIFTTETIGLLDDVSISKLRTKGFKKLEEDEIRKIHYYAGNFPFFNQMACEYIFDAKLQGKDFNETKLKAVLRPHYETLWTHRNEDEKKLLLESLKDKQNIEDFSAERDDMLTRGLLRKVNDTFYRPFSEFFFNLIESNFKEISPGFINKKTLTGFIAGIAISFILLSKFSNNEFIVNAIVSFIVGIPASYIANMLPQIKITTKTDK